MTGVKSMEHGASCRIVASVRAEARVCGRVSSKSRIIRLPFIGVLHPVVCNKVMNPYLPLIED
jgi:hypothetical protein